MSEKKAKYEGKEPIVQEYEFESDTDSVDASKIKHPTDIRGTRKTKY